MTRESGFTVSRGRLWFGLLGGAIAWLMHLLSAYAIAEFGCVSELAAVRLGGLSAVAWLILGASVASELFALVATGVAFRSVWLLRMHGREPQETRGAWPFLARAGLYSSGLFGVVILVETFPIFYYLRGC